MTDEILSIFLPPFPFDPDATMIWVHLCDNSDDNLNDCVKAGCYKISFRDSLKLRNDISGVNQEFLGPAESLPKTEGL